MNICQGFFKQSKISFSNFVIDTCFQTSFVPIWNSSKNPFKTQKQRCYSFWTVPKRKKKTYRANPRVCCISRRVKTGKRGSKHQKHVFFLLYYKEKHSPLTIAEWHDQPGWRRVLGGQEQQPLCSIHDQQPQQQQWFEWPPSPPPLAGQ